MDFYLGKKAFTCPSHLVSTVMQVGVMMACCVANAPRFCPEYHIDVQDDARVHLVALLDPTVQNERLFAFADLFSWADVLAILTRLRPDNKKIPKAPENQGQHLYDVKPRKRAEDLIKSFFGVSGWTSLEDSIAAGIKDLE